MNNICGAITRWQGQERAALVHESDGKSLMGMALLKGNRLVLDATEDGSVFIGSLDR